MKVVFLANTCNKTDHTGLKTVPENGAFTCVPLCFRSLRRFERCLIEVILGMLQTFLGTKKISVTKPLFSPILAKLKAIWTQGQSLLWNLKNFLLNFLNPRFRKLGCVCCPWKLVKKKWVTLACFFVNSDNEPWIKTGFNFCFVPFFCSKAALVAIV